MDCKTKLILWRSGFKLYTMYNLFILIDHMLRPNQLFVVIISDGMNKFTMHLYLDIVTWNQLKTYKWTKDNMEQIIKCFSCLILLTILFSMESLIFYPSSNFKTTNITFGCTGVKQILFGLALLYAHFVVLQNDRKPACPFYTSSTEDCHFYTSSTEAQNYNTAYLLFYSKNILTTFLIISLNI